MERPPNHPLVEVSEEEIQRIRQHFNIDWVKIQQTLDAIEEWAKKEEHLTEAFKYIDKILIERMVIVEKGSVEKTKLRIDRLLTTRGMLPELCLNNSIDEFYDLTQHINVLVLPKLHPEDLTRVKIIRLLNENGNKMDLLTIFRYAYLILDYIMNFDYNLGERYIIDYKYFNMTGFSKLNPFILRKGEILTMESYGIRVKGFHTVNAPPFIDQIITLAKKVTKEKIANRIYIHNTFEDLHKQIPKEILPEEYGGDLKSCSALHEQWMTTLKTAEARKIIEKSNKIFSDESKRSSYKFNSEYLGLPGSFNKLVVD